MKQRPELELNYMKRLSTSDYYFEVWVRSTARPDVKQGTIVERGPQERRNLAIAAGALAESLCEKYGDDRDPTSAAVLAEETYDRMLRSNPIPQVGDERPL